VESTGSKLATNTRFTAMQSNGVVLYVATVRLLTELSVRSLKIQSVRRRD